jgi:hypothetical protein
MGEPLLNDSAVLFNNAQAYFQDCELRMYQAFLSQCNTHCAGAENLNIVREITGQRRNRVFAYQKYLDILSEGTEAL